MLSRYVRFSVANARRHFTAGGANIPLPDSQQLETESDSTPSYPGQENLAASSSRKPGSAPFGTSESSSSAVPPTPSSSADIPQSNLPATIRSPEQDPGAAPSYTSNPFDTHRFYKSLEKDLPSPIAYTLMRATRSLIVSRMVQTQRDVVGVMESENQQYLYRAALSELRTELSMRTKNESAALQTSTVAVRKDVELLSAKMKEDIATMKHDIQMEMNNRKNEVNADVKASKITIEELYHRATVTISDLRTDIEQAKWDNTRRGVAVIALFVMFVIGSLEMAPKPTPKLASGLKPHSSSSLPHVNYPERAQLDQREFEEASEG